VSPARAQRENPLYKCCRREDRKQWVSVRVLPRLPPVLCQVHPPGARKPDALGGQPVALRARCGAARRQGNPALCVDHPMPGDTGIGWQAPEGVADSTRGPGQSCLARHVAVGGYLSRRNQHHHLPDTLVDVGLFLSHRRIRKSPLPGIGPIVASPSGAQALSVFVHYPPAPILRPTENSACVC
jgi:hypothetical protein